MIRTSVRAAVAALVVMAALAGCGSRNAPVARVADRTLTVADFARVASGNESTVPGPPEQAKATLLRELVQRELVLLAAHRHGLDTLQSSRRFAQTTERKLLLQALYRQIAPADMGVSEGEARAMHAARAVQADAHVIYTGQEPLIRLAAAKLAAGAKFADVANTVNEPNTLPPGGALGMRSPGDLFPPLDEALRTQPIGVVGGPWQTPQGWFLLQVTSRITAAQPPFEVQRTALMEMVRQRKQRQALTDGMLALEREYHLEVAPEGPSMLFRFMTPARVLDAPHWMPDAKEQKVPLATYDGGAYTMGDAMQDLLDRTDVRGPEASSIDGMRAWIQGQAITRISVLEAKRRHLDQEPAVADKLRDAIENHLAEADVLQAVANVSGVDVASARAAWESAKHLYPQLRSARVVWVASTDTSAIGRLARRAAPGASLRTAAAAVSPALAVREETLRFPSQDPAWSELQGQLAQMAPGAWTGEIFTGTDWRVVQLVDKSVAPIDWEQLTPQQQAQVARGVSDRAKQERYTAYMDSLWKATNPVLMPENLRRVPWPLPVVADAAP